MRVLRFLLGLSTRLKVIIAVVVVALGIFVIAYFEPHKLWIDEEVNEDFPAPVAVATTTVTPEATPVTEAPTTTSPLATTTTLDVAETSQAENPERGFSPASEEEKEQSPATTTSTTIAPTTTTTTVPPTTTTTKAVPEGPVLLSSSEWIGIGHPGTGTVLLYRQPDGSHVIRFEDLEVSNGPDLLVILSQAPLVNDRAAYSAAEYLSLGDLKGNKGNQN